MKHKKTLLQCRQGSKFLIDNYKYTHKVNLRCKHIKNVERYGII